MKVKSRVVSKDKIGLVAFSFIIIGLILNIAFPSLFSIGGPSITMAVVSIIVLIPILIIWIWSVTSNFIKVPDKELSTKSLYALEKNTLYSIIALVVFPLIGFLCNTWLGVLIGIILFISTRIYSPKEELLSKMFRIKGDEYCKNEKIRSQMLFSTFILEKDLPEELVLRHDSQFMYHSIGLLALSLAEIALALNRLGIFHFFFAIILFSGFVVFLFEDISERTTIIPSGIAITRKIFFFSFIHFIMKEEIQSIKYSILRASMDDSGGFIIINRYKGRACKILHIVKPYNELIKDLDNIRERLLQILSIPSESNNSMFVQKK